MVRTKAVGLKSGSRAITVPIRQVGYGVQRQGGELNRRCAARENYQLHMGHQNHHTISRSAFPFELQIFFSSTPNWTVTCSKTEWSPLSSQAALMS